MTAIAGARRAAPDGSRPPGAGGTFASLDEPVRRALQDIGVSRRWRAGQVVAWAGEPSRSAFLVERGRVRFRTIDEGGDEMLAGWLGTGQIVALAPTLSVRRLPWDIVAEGACTALHWEHERLERLMARDAAVAGVTDGPRAGIVPVVLQVTQADLAKAVGGSRYRVGEALGRLEAAGIVALSRGRIELLQRP